MESKNEQKLREQLLDTELRYLLMCLSVAVFIIVDALNEILSD